MVAEGTEILVDLPTGETEEALQVILIATLLAVVVVEAVVVLLLENICAAKTTAARDLLQEATMEDKEAQ